jgi:putative membrane protein
VPHERLALSVVGVAVVAFAVHGVVHEVPGTLEYVLTVSGLMVLLSMLRARPLPAPIALAAGASAVVHLAGGLVRIGDDVLYNASAGSELLRYDHFGHALGIFVGAQLVWELLVRDAFALTGRGSLVALTVLAALGLGALNEVVEFVATVAHGGGHAGGYTNTGWDLVTNTVAGLLAGAVIHRRRRDVDGHVEAHRASTAVA